MNREGEETGAGAAGMQVDENCKIEPALSRPDVGDVAHPGLVRAAGMKGSGKDVWRNLELMIRVRCGPETAPFAAALPPTDTVSRALTGKARAPCRPTLKLPSALARSSSRDA